MKRDPMLHNIFKTAMTAMIIADLAEIAGAIIDGMMTGRYLGADAMAACGIAKPFFSITGILSAILSSGSMTVSSHMIGKGDRTKTQDVFSLACFIGTMSSVTVALLGVIFAVPFARLLGADDTLCPVVSRYLIGLFTGVPAIVMGNVLTIFLQLEGKYGSVSLGVFANIAVNLGGDALNIFYFGGDMLGMGLATSASYYAALMILLYRFIGKKTMFRFSLRNIRWEMLRDILQKGMPKATRRLCNVFRPLLVNRMVMTAGGYLAMSGLSVQHNAADFLELLGTCCADVVVLMCGVFYGEESEEDLSGTLLIAFRYLLFGVTGISLLSFFGAKIIAVCYLGDQAEAVAAGTLCLQICAFRLPFLAFNEIYLNYFQAIGDSKRAHFLTTMHRLGYIVVCAFVLGNLFGITGIWVAFPLSELLLSVTIVIMAAIHEKQFPHKIRQLLFLPAGFGVAPKYRFRKAIKNADNVIEVSRSACDFCKENNINKKRSYYVALCIEELGMNAVKYGLTQKGHGAEITLSLVHDELLLRFRDNGNTFDPTNWFEMCQSEDKTSHIGIRMVLGLAKEVTYTNSLNTNNVLIRL